ncbi:MAG: 3-dehydroquinate synthase [Planctomycetaceae bacterium]|nr:3-dehydroquinate synthase [Planctomycetaceae bacterium]
MNDYISDADSQVTVNLASRSYSIEIKPGLLNQLSKALGSFVSNEHVILVTDSNVAELYLESVVSQISEIAQRVDVICVNPGEESKSIPVCNELWQQMVDFNTDRQSVVVALGGGVVGDLAGFLAASFARGIRFIQIPTTLLAQVDSSVGGKVGVNLPSAKNMVGAFWQPEVVLIDPLVLETLDEANFRAGLAEVIKYGLIMDVDFFASLESSADLIGQREPEVLTRCIARCCQCKAAIVEEDERETSGRRAILNYGHTYGHAIEAVFGYGRFLHGEAIAIGMTCAARLAREFGMVPDSFVTRQTELFRKMKLPVDCPAERHDELLASMKHDKKVARGELKLILPVRIGEVVVLAAPEDQLILNSLKN